MNEVFHYDVHAILVESTMIAEAEQVEFQTLALYHLDIGDIANTDFCKSGCPVMGQRLVNSGPVETHPVVIAGMLVIKCLQYFGGIVLTVFCLSPQKGKLGVLSILSRPYIFSDTSVPHLVEAKNFSNPSLRNVHAGQCPQPSPGIPL